MSASAADMGRFMIALLQPNPLVQPELLPRGFEDDYAAGNRFVGKHGLTNGAFSHLAVLPEAGFSMFVSYNTVTPLNGQTELLEAIARRYFQRPERRRARCGGPDGARAVEAPRAVRSDGGGAVVDGAAGLEPRVDAVTRQGRGADRGDDTALREIRPAGIAPGSGSRGERKEPRPTGRSSSLVRVRTWRSARPLTCARRAWNTPALSGLGWNVTMYWR